MQREKNYKTLNTDNLLSFEQISGLHDNPVCTIRQNACAREKKDIWAETKGREHLPRWKQKRKKTPG